MAPEKIAHYRIIRRLGAGGMGEVYLAEDERLGRPLALKIILPKYTLDDEMLRRFEQEARSASALNHPNIITIYEIGQDGDEAHGGRRHYIAAEYVKGQTLRQRMRGQRLEIVEALDVAIQVAKALSAAHAAGIVHRDIKPENVMVCGEGDDCHVKVLDFGLSKLLGEPHGETTSRTSQAAGAGEEDAETQPMHHTAPGVAIGTVRYMSPEQARGAGVDGRADVWSLGVVLYEMITARTPFDGATDSHVLVAVLDHEPAPLERHRPDAPEELRRIAATALAKNPDARYQTAGEMLADLRRLRQRLELEALLPDASTRHDDTDDARRVLDAYAGSLDDTETPEQHRAAVELQRGARTTGRQHVARATVADPFRAPKKSANKWRVWAVAATLVVAASVALFFYFNRPAERISSLAVMPFLNEGDNPDAEYLSDGVTESLINSLSQTLGVKVMSRNSVFRYKGRGVEPRQVGSELGVSAVLTGRLVQRGDELTVSVELIDARDNSQIWGEKYKRRMSDLLSVQEEIARDITERLRRRLQRQGDSSSRDAASSSATPREPKRYTANPEAFRAYLRGRYFWNRRNEEGFRKAIEHFEQAIQIDPGYALAYAGLADCHALLSDYSIVPPREAMPKAKAAALRAIEIDDTLAEGYTSLAFVQMAYEWKWADAEENFKRAIALNPNYATARQWYASCLVQMNRTDEALAESRRAQELDPLSLIINANSGLYLYYAGQYDRALEQVNKTVEVDPTFGVARLYLGYIYLQKPGHTPKAIAELQHAVKLMGDDAETHAALGHAYAVAGRTNEAREILNKLQTPKTGGYVSPYFLAVVHAGLGDNTGAFENLRRARDDRHPGLILLKIDPRFNALRPDPQFAELIRQVEHGA